MTSEQLYCWGEAVREKSRRIIEDTLTCVADARGTVDRVRRNRIESARQVFLCRLRGTPLGLPSPKLASPGNGSDALAIPGSPHSAAVGP